VSEGTQRLLHRLDLRETKRTENSVTWRGEAGENAMNMAGRLFGGMVLAQTIVAAGRTVPERRVHSLQQVFLRGGAADLPLRYRCEVLFEGRTYSSARVEVEQADEVISHAMIGFTAGVPGGPDRQLPTTARARLADTANRDQYRNRPNWRDQPIEVRAVREHEEDGEPRLDTWLRPFGPLPDDQVLHQAALAYVSDRAFLSTPWKPVRAELGPARGATLDHTIWFHRPVQFDDWHVYAMHGPALIDGRGLSQGTIHHCNGTLVATVAQQGAMRGPRPS